MRSAPSGVGNCVVDSKTIELDSTTILELAARIWAKVNGDRAFHYVSDAPYRYDVPFRVPDVRKARALLGFEATTSLDEMLDEVIPWIRAELASGGI